MGIFNTNMPKEGEIIHGKYGEYVLCNELGHGGNGLVFDIRIIENNYSVYQSTQRYVIKILILKKTRRTDEKEKRRIRFQREITAVRQVGNQKLDIGKKVQCGPGFHSVVPALPVVPGVVLPGTVLHKQGRHEKTDGVQ